MNAQKKEKERGAYGGDLAIGGVGALEGNAPADSQSVSSESPVAPKAPAMESPEQRAKAPRKTGMPGAPQPADKEFRPGSELGSVP